MGKITDAFGVLTGSKQVAEANTLFGNTTLGNNVLVGTGGQAATIQQQYVSISGVTSAGKTMSLTEISRNATVKTCLDLKARTLAQLPIEVKVTLDDGSVVDIDHKEVSQRERDKAKAVLSLLNNPNNFQTRYEFYWQLSAWISLTGEGYVLLWRKNQDSATQTPVELYVLDSSLMVATIGPTRYPRYKISSPNTNFFDTSIGQLGFKDKQEFEAHQILHYKEQPWQGSAGFNKLTQAVELISLDQDCDVYANFVMKNGAKITGVFSLPQGVKIPDEIYKQVEQRLKTQLSNMANTNSNDPSPPGSSLLLEDGAMFNQLSMMKVTDTDLLNLKKFSTERICALFGVPPAMIGLGDKSFNNTSVLLDEYYRSTLYPMLVNLQEHLDKSLLKGFPRLCLQFDTSDLLKGSVNDQADYAIAMVRAGLMTPNEGRRYVGMSAIKDEHADMLHIPVAGTTGEEEEDKLTQSPQQTSVKGQGGPSGAVAASNNGGQNK